MILPVAIDFANVNLLWVEVMEPVCSLGFQAFILRFVCERLQFSTANPWGLKKSNLRNYHQQGFLQNCAAEVTIVTEVHEVAQVAEVAEVAKVALVLIFHVILFLQNGPLQLTSISLHGIHVLDIHTSISMLWHSEIHLYHICSLHNFYQKLVFFGWFPSLTINVCSCMGIFCASFPASTIIPETHPTSGCRNPA